jgi:hypothetical protein
MKKLTLSIGLLASMLYTNAQDTTCTYFVDNIVVEFDYKTSVPLYETVQTSEFYEIDIKIGNTLCLDLSDGKNTTRKVIVIFSDGSRRQEVLDSKDNVYVSPLNAIKVLVGKPKLKIRK